MSTIAEGLQKILDTKDDIRHSINSKDVALKDYVPFDMYPDAILAIAQADDGTSAVTYSMSENIYNREQVFSIDDQKWHMAKGDGTYEDWGTYGTDFSVKYDGKLTVVGGYEYEYSAATESWMNLGEVSQMPSAVGTFLGSWNVQNYANGSINNESGGEYNPAVQRTTSNYMANITVSQDGTYVNVPQSPNAESWPAGAGGFEVAQVNFNNNTPFTIIVKGRQTSSYSDAFKYMLGFTWGAYRGLYMSPDGILALGGSDGWTTDIKCQTTWTPSAPAEVMVRCDGNGTIELVNLTDGTSASTSDSFSIDKIGVFGWPSYDSWGGGWSFETMKGAGDFYWIFVDNEYHDDTVVADIVSHENGPIGLVKEYSPKSAPAYDVTYADISERDADKNTWKGLVATVTDADGSGTTKHYICDYEFNSPVWLDGDGPIAEVEIETSISSVYSSWSGNSQFQIELNMLGGAFGINPYAAWVNAGSPADGKVGLYSPIRMVFGPNWNAGGGYQNWSQYAMAGIRSIKWNPAFMLMCQEFGLNELVGRYDAVSGNGSVDVKGWPKRLIMFWQHANPSNPPSYFSNSANITVNGFEGLTSFNGYNSSGEAYSTNPSNKYSDVITHVVPAGCDTSNTILSHITTSSYNGTTKVVYRDGVTACGFFGCNTESVTYPKSVTSIKALDGTYNTVLATTPPSLLSRFNNTPWVEKVYVPNGTLSAYSEATNWSEIYEAGKLEELPA